MALDRDGPKSKVVDLAMEKNSSVDHIFIRGYLDVEIGPTNLQIMLKFQFRGAPRANFRFSSEPPRKFCPELPGQTYAAQLFGSNFCI